MARADWAEFHEGKRKPDVTVGAEFFHRTGYLT
jgi:hypothetical protein